MHNPVYLDNNATTRVAPEVVTEMQPYFSEWYGNPSSMYTFGGKVAGKIHEARERVAKLIGAKPEEIIFTGSGTESDNTAIWAAVNTNPDKRHIVTSRVEHPAIKNHFEYLAKQGYEVTFVGVDGEGRLDMDQFYASLRPDTAVVSLMWANNETGVIFPVEELSREVCSRGIVFHTDAVQSAGKVPINVADTGIGMLAISGHKLHAPKGVGILYVRKGTKFTPMLIGGHQEHGRRGGTENVASIIGLGKACEMAGAYLDSGEEAALAVLRDRLEKGLLERIPNAKVNGADTQRVPNTSNIAFEFVEGEAILLLMNEFGICASSGSACTSGSLEPSHVMRAMGVPFTSAHGSIRFSLSRYNTAAEIDYVLEKMPPIIEKLRLMSPYWKQR